MSIEQINAGLPDTSFVSLALNKDEKLNSVSQNKMEEKILSEDVKNNNVKESSQLDKEREASLKLNEVENDAAKDEQKLEIKQAMELMNQLIPIKETNLIFEFDDIADPPIIKVVDKESDEVIREIPPKVLQEIAQALSDVTDISSGKGVLFNSEV